MSKNGKIFYRWEEMRGIFRLCDSTSYSPCMLSFSVIMLSRVFFPAKDVTRNRFFSHSCLGTKKIYQLLALLEWLCMFVFLWYVGKSDNIW